MYKSIIKNIFTYLDQLSNDKQLSLGFTRIENIPFRSNYYRIISETSKSYILDKYRKYNQLVENSVKDCDLLIWKPSDGWEPLCNFLKVQIPDTPFPSIKTEISKDFSILIFIWISAITAILIVLFLSIFY